MDHLFREFEALMEIARSHLRPGWEAGEVLVVKTTKGRVHVVEIPDFLETSVREPLENRCIQTLAEENDTEVMVCLATMNGRYPEIPSWNFRRGLLELNAKNLQTETFLWGGREDDYHLKPFSELLPPNYKI